MILISAYAFSPYCGSECAVGWNIVTLMAKYHDVTVLCGDVSGRLQTKIDLEKYFSENPAVENLHIEYVEPSLLIRWIERIHRIPGFWGCYYLAYNLWQRKAYGRAKEMMKALGPCPLDIVHQLNMIGYREPGYLWKLGVPFVWGPVGGASNEPLAFRSLFSFSGFVKVIMRTILNEIQKRTSFRSKMAARKASKIWAVTTDDLRLFKTVWGVSAEQMNEAGTVYQKGAVARKWDGRSSLRIVWSGLHTPRKALPILLHAMAEGMRGKKFNSQIIAGDSHATCNLSFDLPLTSCDVQPLPPVPRPLLSVHIDVLGSGTETNAWKKMAKQLGVDSVITWHGTVSRNTALELMNLAHVSVITSLKEATSIVLLEALSLGLPVICHDACGMGLAINDGCGIKVPLLDPETSIQGFSQAIRKFLQHPELVEALSRGALVRADELSWDKNAATIAAAYEQVVEGK